jgi:maltooligosyltrehalose trehalohydrolase
MSPNPMSPGPMSPDHVFQLSGGASLISSDTTRFRLWAPDRHVVSLELDSEPLHPMTRLVDGWFELDLPVGAGTRYRFRVEPHLAVPDPMSRFQVGDIHGFSVVVDPGEYIWQVSDWCGRPWPEVVIYELHVGLLGGFKGVMAELPALQALGITAIELMPVSDFPGARNWGYDGVLPFAPDAAYGTPADFKALVDDAHRLGMMVFLDVVYNHFGPDGNYLHQYASAFFRPDEQTPWGAALDFRQPNVRRYFIENALYWLEEYQMDGLRLDAVQAISSQDWLPELSEAVRRTFPDRHIHLMLENDGNVAELLEHDFAAQWNDDIHHALHILLTGETGGYYGDYAQAPIEMLARCLREGFAFQGEASPYRGGLKRGTSSSRLPPDRFIFFLQNHDQIGNRAFGERLTQLTSLECQRIAVALQLLSPQIPLLFMGEEHGSHQPFLYFTSHAEELAEAVRQGRQREFAQFPEFSQSDALKRLPDPNAADTFERCRPEMAPASMEADTWRQFYGDLLAIRTASIVPRLTGCHGLKADALSPRALIASWVMGDGHKLTIAFNLGDAPVALPSPLTAPLFTLNTPSKAAATHELPGISFIACLQPPSQ